MRRFIVLNGSRSITLSAIAVLVVVLTSMGWLWTSLASDDGTPETSSRVQLMEVKVNGEEGAMLLDAVGADGREALHAKRSSSASTGAQADNQETSISTVEGVVSGVVVDQAEVAVFDCVVYLSIKEDRLGKTNTDRAGRFEFREKSLHAGEPFSVVARHPYFLPRGFSGVLDEDAQARGTVLSLERGLTITVRVLGEGEGVLEGAFVVASQDGGFDLNEVPPDLHSRQVWFENLCAEIPGVTVASTDANGRVSLGGFSSLESGGIVDVRLEKDGFVPLVMERILLEGRSTNLGDVTLSRGAVVEGHVV